MSECQRYGLKKDSHLGRMVNHLREEHRLKVGVDYWIMENQRTIISRPTWVPRIRMHFPFFGVDVQILEKDKPGKNQKVLKPLDIKESTQYGKED